MTELTPYDLAFKNLDFYMDIIMDSINSNQDLNPNVPKLITSLDDIKDKVEHAKQELSEELDPRLFWKHSWYQRDDPNTYFIKSIDLRDGTVKYGWNSEGKYVYRTVSIGYFLGMFE